MGYIAHDAVVVVTHSYREGGLPDMEAFRASLPTDLRPLVIGPVAAPINGYVIYAFLPDGSKEGWSTSDDADEAREMFKDLFRFSYEDGLSADDWIHARFGGDEIYEQGSRLIESYPRKKEAR